MGRMEKTVTEYRLIAQFPGKDEYVAMRREGDGLDPALMAEEYSWYLTERVEGEFVRIEKRTKTIVTTDWEEVGL